MRPRPKAGLVVGAVALVLLTAACAKSGSTGGGAYGAPAPGSSGTGGTHASGYGSGGGRYGGGGGGKAPKGTVDQGQGGFVFSPSTLTVAQGKTITVKNVGSVPHTFTIQGHGIDITNNPGQSQQVKVDLSPGTYTFICRFHVNLGMKGTITVT